MRKKAGIGLIILGILAVLIAVPGIRVGHCGADGGTRLGSGMQALNDQAKLLNEVCQSTFISADGTILVIDQQYYRVVPWELILVSVLLVAGGIMLLLRRPSSKSGKIKPLGIEKPKEE